MTQLDEAPPDLKVQELVEAAGQVGQALDRFARAYGEALKEWTRQWPPERVLEAVLADYSRCMAEINGRTQS